MFECLIIFEIFVSFLVNLSRRLCLVRRPSVRPSVVIVLHFRLLLSNHWTKFSETWQLQSFVVWGPIRKTRWSPLPLIGWYIFGFFSETDTRNSTKLDRKQDLNFLYHVWVFRADRKWRPRPLIGWDIFDVLPWKRLTKFNGTWQEVSTSSTMFVISGYWKNKMAILASYWPRHFRLPLWNRWT